MSSFPLPAPACADCIFWSRRGRDPRGECRRNAPDSAAGSFGSWPLTEPSEWCGSFESTGGDSFGACRRLHLNKARRGAPLIDVVPA